MNKTSGRAPRHMFAAPVDGPMMVVVPAPVAIAAAAAIAAAGQLARITGASHRGAAPAGGSFVALSGHVVRINVAGAEGLQAAPA